MASRLEVATRETPVALVVVLDLVLRERILRQFRRQAAWQKAKTSRNYAQEQMMRHNQILGLLGP